ncbi:MAG: DUF2971 domain-containing protein [Clostridiales bacterium]|nr:DUF2971 domain-containing protein [Clostridiales bacterium]
MRNYLWFSNPTTFNDPYDFNLSFDYSCNEDTLRKYFLKMKAIYSKRGDNSLLDFDFEKRISDFKNDPIKFISAIKKYVKGLIQNNYGVCCFSENYDNLLMWSHYADKHEGICLGFDADLKDKFFEIPLIVKYPETYPIVNYFENYLNKATPIVQFHFATKSKDWSYENELRIVKDIGQHDKIRGEINFNKDIVKEVIFGYKTKPKKIDKIVKLFMQLSYKVDFFKMELHDNDFGLKKVKKYVG